MNKKLCSSFTYLRHFDFLSTEAKLTFNSKGDTRIKTPIGGLLSLISVIASITLFLFFFVQFIDRQNKTYVSSSEYSPNVNISESNRLPFMLRLSNAENEPYENPNSVYKIGLNFWFGGEASENGSQKKGHIPIEMERCDINKHFGEYKYLFANLTDISTFFCPVMRNYTQTIYGIYGNTNPFSYYHFVIYKCSESNGGNCIDKDTQEKLLTSTYVDMRTVDVSINSNEHYVKTPTIRTDRHMLSTTVFKRIWIYLNWVTYSTDDNFFITSKRTESFHQVHSFRYDTDLRNISETTTPGTFGSLSVLANGNTMIYSRRYHKIQDFFASVSGIISFIFNFVFFINYFVSLNSYYISLINGFVFENYKDIYNKQNISLDEKGTKNTHEIIVKPKMTLTNLVSNDRSSKKIVNIKWYRRFLPFVYSVRKSKSIIERLESVNRYLSVFEIMKATEISRLLKTYLLGESSKELSPLKQKYKKKNILLKTIEKGNKSENNMYNISNNNESKVDLNSEK